MIMHVLKAVQFEFDYLVGAQLPDFDLMVRLSDAPVIVIEGDEYLTSPIDPRPKFLHYTPHLSVITGIAWDHMNVFPTWPVYVDQFRQFLVSLDPASARVFAFAGDEVLKQLAKEVEIDISYYHAVTHQNSHQGAIAADSDGHSYPMKFFGMHNFENMQAAWLVCAELGISESDFFTSMQSFSGASMRLEPWIETEDLVVYRDFAHAPSKVKASVEALRQRYPEKRITVFLELHTFSSLNKAFLPQYLGSLNAADQAYVYYSPHTLEMKNLPAISPEFVRECFGGAARIFTNMNALLGEMTPPFSGVHAWMSSGRFDNTQIREIYQDST